MGVLEQTYTELALARYRSGLPEFSVRPEKRYHEKRVLWRMLDAAALQYGLSMAPLSLSLQYIEGDGYESLRLLHHPNYAADPVQKTTLVTWQVYQVTAPNVADIDMLTPAGADLLMVTVEVTREIATQCRKLQQASTVAGALARSF